MAHHCHATGCTVRTPPQMFMCKQHWFMVPKPLRDLVWATYRTGQCDDWKISSGYADAAIAAVKAVAEKEGIEPDISLYESLRPGNVVGDLVRVVKSELESK